MMRKTFRIGLLTVALVLYSLLSTAQEIGIGVDEAKPIEERILYSRQNSIDATVHSQGFGLGFHIGRIRSIYKLTAWEFGAYTLRSLKQVRVANSVLFAAKPYVYGKLNDVLVIRGGYGQEQRIYGKPYWGGVELRYAYAAGVSLAVMKPYYYHVKAVRPLDGNTYIEEETYQPFDSVASWTEIIGRAPFKEGFDQLRIAPGIYVKGGLVFDFGMTKTRTQAIEIGAAIDGFPTGIALKADPQELSKHRRQHLFITFFLSYRWGRRFN